MPTHWNSCASGFHGEITSRKELSHFILTEMVYPPRFHVPPHMDEHPWFGFVLQGSVTETDRKQSIDLATYSMVYRAAEEVHSDRFHDLGGRCLIVEMKRSLVDQLSIKIRDSYWPAEFAGGHLAELGHTLHRELFHVDAVSDLSVESLALEIIVGVYRFSAVIPSCGGPPLWLQKVRELLHERFCEGLTLSEIAGAGGIHPTHLAREFRKWYGVSVGEYVRKLRVAFAYRKIVETDTPLAQIALEAGFSDQAHFSRTLKRTTGNSPNRLRADSILR